MEERDLFPGPHGGQGSIGVIGTMGSSQRLGAPCPPWIPSCPALAETMKSPGHPDRALATDQATHERETNTAILPNKALCFTGLESPYSRL